MRLHNIFQSLPAFQTAEVFEPLVDTPGLTLERIVSNGQATPPGEWYDQDHDEWVMVLTGSAGLLWAHIPQVYTLTAGDYVYIPAHQCHRVEWTDKHQPTIWLALHIKAS